MSRGLCIAIHDVAPATWLECEVLLKMLEGLGAPPVTLLIVPEYHRLGRIDREPWFLHAIDARIASGAEVALHGYFHLDEAPLPNNPAAWLRRRILTNGEGEFSALSIAEAGSRIERGRALLEACGWQVAGFVPPAWLAGEAAQRAIGRSSLAYTSSRSFLQRIADGVRISAPCITASARSPWRRSASRLWLKAMEAATARTPLLRIALHPNEAKHPGMVTLWAQVIRHVAADRTMLTKCQAVERYSCAAKPR